MTDLAATPPKVAKMALAPEKLPLDRLALIGLRATPQGNSALVRLPDGEIRTLTQGARADGMTVMSVGTDTLTLVDAKGFAHTLTMPG